MPYRGIEDPVKLRRLLESTLLLGADLELTDLLQHVIEEARSMTGARYGALGVLDPERTGLSRFITVGLSSEEERSIGPRPTGRGVLGVLISDPRPVRLNDIRAHADSYGFPPGHPPMTSFLGVPVKVRDEVYGNLYLTDKIGWSEFTEDDERLVQGLGLTAGIAIENAQLHRLAKEAAVLEDRDRLARDLHDTVIQRLFATGLSLQAVLQRLDDPSRERVAAAVTDLDQTIREIRTAIFELGMAETDTGARSRVLAVMHDLEPMVGFEVPVSFEGPVDTALDATVTEHLLAVVREAVTNIGKHARATKAGVSLMVAADRCTLTVTDDGIGVGVNTTPGAQELGLANLERRAEKLRGTFSAQRPDEGGTRLVWSVPLPSGPARSTP